MNGYDKEIKLLFDHDVLQVNLNWYSMCLSAIERTGHGAGWITGVTNAIACPNQLCPGAPKNDNIMAHMTYARKRFNKYVNHLKLVDHKTIRLPFSGFMILTHRKCWEDSGKYTDGFLGVDNEYFKALSQRGYRFIPIPRNV